MQEPSGENESSDGEENLDDDGGHESSNDSIRSFTDEAFKNNETI